MQAIRTITLDLDDTLWAIHPVIHRAEAALYQWLREHRPRITERYSRDDLRALRKDVVRDFAARRHELTFMRRMVLERAAKGAGEDTDFVDEAFAVFDNERNDVELFPEVVASLEQLSSQFRLIALTNGNADLEKIGINGFFGGCVSATTAGAPKPKPQIFDAAVAMGGAAAEQTLHVGDHAIMDVDGARQAGLRTCWVNRHAAPWPTDLPPPDLHVRDIGVLARQLCGDGAAVL